MFFELFVLGSTPFWGLLTAEFGFLFWCVAGRKGDIGLCSILLVAAALQLFGDIPIFQWIWHNKLTMLFNCLCYVAISISWGFIKWWFFVRDNNKRYDDILATYLQSKPDLPDNPNNFTI